MGATFTDCIARKTNIAGSRNAKNLKTRMRHAIRLCGIGLVLLLALCAGNAGAQTITVVAGTQTTSGSESGNGGQATAATLNSPIGLAFDASGNMYIADQTGNCVRVVNTSGVISVFAGTPGSSGSSGDGGQATNAKLNSPSGLAVDNSNNLLIADYDNDVVRKVNISTGIITKFAGTYGSATESGDGFAATAATLTDPFGLAVDASSNVYISDYYASTIRVVNSSGNISHFAGSSGSGYAGDGGAAATATLFYPAGMCVDVSGNLYVADRGSHVVRIINLSSGIINTFAVTIQVKDSNGISKV